MTGVITSRKAWRLVEWMAKAPGASCWAKVAGAGGASSTAGSGASSSVAIPSGGESSGGGKIFPGASASTKDGAQIQVIAAKFMGGKLAVLLV